jgi:hypothetical protein
MGAEPVRHISRLIVDITMPASLDAKARTILERCGHHCPVETSLGDLTKVEISFRYI